MAREISSRRADRLREAREKRPNATDTLPFVLSCGEVRVDAQSPRTSTDAEGGVRSTPAGQLQVRGADLQEGVYVSRTPQTRVQGQLRNALYEPPARRTPYPVGKRVFIGERWYSATVGGLTSARPVLRTPSRLLTDGEVTWKRGGAYRYRGIRLDAQNTFIAPAVRVPMGLMDLWPITSDPITIRLCTGADVCFGAHTGSKYSHRRHIFTVNAPVVAGTPFRVGFRFDHRLAVVVNGELLLQRDNPEPEGFETMPLGGEGRGVYYAYNLLGIAEVSLRRLMELTRFD